MIRAAAERHFGNGRMTATTDGAVTSGLQARPVDRTAEFRLDYRAKLLESGDRQVLHLFGSAPFGALDAARSARGASGRPPGTGPFVQRMDGPERMLQVRLFLVWYQPEKPESGVSTRRCV